MTPAADAMDAAFVTPAAEARAAAVAEAEDAAADMYDATAAEPTTVV